MLSIPIMKCTKWKVFSNCTENIFIFLVILLLLLHFLPSSLLNGGQISGFLRWLEFCDNLLSTHWNLKQKTILQLYMNNVSRHTSMTLPAVFFLNTSLSCTYGCTIHLFKSYQLNFWMPVLNVLLAANKMRKWFQVQVK